MTARFVTGILSAGIAIVALALSPSSVGAWGEKGHRLVGLVAKELLDKDALNATKALMGSDDLAKFALFLDDHKAQLNKDIPGSRDWHFDDVPVCTAEPAECPGGNCASRQIRVHQRILADTHRGREERQFAVYVLTHLIGDIHQPLHAADNNDVGGNEVFVSLPVPAGSSAEIRKLHGLWDTELVERQFSGRSEIDAAKKLVADHATKAETEGWKKGKGNASAWIAESHVIAVDKVYKTLPGFICDRDLEGDPIPIPQTYVDNGQKVIDEQIAKAGYRLAAVLSRLLRD